MQDYGKDVRNSIHDAIKQTYDDASEKGNANMEVVQARGGYKVLNERLDNSDRVKAEKEELEKVKENLENQINTMQDGTPVFVNSVNEMTDTSKAYVNLADGYLYRYENGNWSKKIVYQAIGIKNGSVTPEKTSFIIKTKSKNLYNAENKEDNKTIAPNGTVSNYNDRSVITIYDVKAGDVLYSKNKISQTLLSMLRWCSFDENGNRLTFSDFSNNFEVPNNASYVKCCVATSETNDYFMISKESGSGTEYDRYFVRYSMSNDINVINNTLENIIDTINNKVTSIITEKNTKNLYNPEEKQDNLTLNEDGTTSAYNGRSVITINENFTVGDTLYFKTGTNQILHEIIRVCAYDNNDNRIDYKNFIKNYQIIENTAYLKILDYTEKFDDYFMVSTEAGAGTEYEEYGKIAQISDDINVINTKLEEKLKKIEESNDIENYYSTVALFQKFGVIGDSYASGYVASGSGGGQHISWGQILARMCGNTCINFSRGGLSTRTWLTDSAGLERVLNNDPQQLYFLCLGLNDSHTDSTGVQVGALTDITSHTSYEDYPDTYYGNYGKIIEQVLQHAPNAKLIMCTIANREERYEPYIAAQKVIAKHYEIPCIVEKDDPFFQSEYYQNYRLSNHPVATMYAGMAMAMNRLFSKCALEYNDYFEDYVG